MKKTKSNFDPNKIKFLLESKGFGRVTDKQLANMWGVKERTIARWKIKSPVIFDRIANVQPRTFDMAMGIQNNILVFILGLHQNQIYVWNKSRPNILLKAQEFFIRTGITFEEIYKNEKL